MRIFGMICAAAVALASLATVTKAEETTIDIYNDLAVMYSLPQLAVIDNVLVEVTIVDAATIPQVSMDDICCGVDSYFTPKAKESADHSAHCYQDYVDKLDQIRKDFKTAVAQQCSAGTCGGLSTGYWPCDCVNDIFNNKEDVIEGGMLWKSLETFYWNQYLSCIIHEARN